MSVVNDAGRDGAESYSDVAQADCADKLTSETLLKSGFELSSVSLMDPPSWDVA